VDDFGYIVATMKTTYRDCVGGFRTELRVEEQANHQQRLSILINGTYSNKNSEVTHTTLA